MERDLSCMDIDAYCSPVTNTKNESLALIDFAGRKPRLEEEDVVYTLKKMHFGQSYSGNISLSRVPILPCREGISATV